MASYHLRVKDDTKSSGKRISAKKHVDYILREDGKSHADYINREGEQSGFITGKSKDKLIFYPDDRPIMLDTLKKVEKPVIAFKIYAGGQMFVGKTQEEKRQLIKDVYEEVFTALKPNDIAAIGVFQRDMDQIKEDAELYDEWYASKS